MIKKFCECCGHALATVLEEKLPTYQLLKPIPGLSTGVVFIHDKSDSIKGSIADGCLKLAWDKGNCQDGYCAETHILHANTRQLTDWFRPIQNGGRYTIR